MTPTIDKEALLRIPVTKRGRQKKKNNRGWAATIPGCVLYRNISYIPIWYHVWYHTRYHDAGDEQRGMIAHSYHKQGTKKNVPGVCPGDTGITCPGFRADNMVKTRQLSFFPFFPLPQQYRHNITDTAVVHSYHKQGTKKNVPGVCPGDTRVKSPGFRADNMVKTRQLSHFSPFSLATTVPPQQQYRHSSTATAVVHSYQYHEQGTKRKVPGASRLSNGSSRT